MPPRKRKAVEEAPQEVLEENPTDHDDHDDIEVPALPEDIPMPPIGVDDDDDSSPQQDDMGALAAAAAAAVAVTQPPPMTDAEIAATTNNITTAVTTTTTTAVAAVADPAISRKEKSLAVLCLNFMAVARESPYTPEGMKIIEIQQIAEQLGAKRRRIYDIINILESVNIVSRVKKNTYQWHGTDGLPAMFAVLQKEGLEEMAAKEAEAAATAAATAAGDGGGGDVKSEGGGGSANNNKPDGQIMDTVTGKKTKGVAKTCKKFFQIFLTTGQTHVAVSDAANIIEGPLNPANQKALTRRIYDIANVLQSCGIIEKYNVGSTSDTNKPGFRWSYQVSPDEMSKYLPEGHGNALPLGTTTATSSHNPWSVPMGPNPTLDDPAPEPLDEPLADPVVALPPADADTTEI